MNNFSSVLMSPPIALMTIASANYLPYVKTLMESVKQTNPNYKRYLILVDKGQAQDTIESGDFTVIKAESLDITHFDDMSVRYDVTELNTAVKPFAIEWLFSNTDASSVIYLDPDIHVYRKLSELQRLLEGGSSVVLTPHLTAPVEDGKSPNDYHMLQAGVFNLGFIAVNRRPEAREFVRWWGRRLVTQGHADVRRNLFTDQRWVDLAPCFLSNLSILKNPAYNVAYWNLMQRPVTTRRGKYFFDGQELAFFHFSGLDRDKPFVVSKHQDRLTWKDIKPLQPLFKDYRSKLVENGWRTAKKLAYGYDFSGSLKISPMIRNLYRETYKTPLSDVRVDEDFLLAMCNEPARLPFDQDGLITKLMYQIYRDRPDLQAAFTLTTTEGMSGFVNWFQTSAEREHDLDPRVVQPSKPAQVEEPESSFSSPSAPPAGNAGKPWHYRKWRKARKWILERI